MACRAPVLRDVVEEHLEEMGYLAIQRRRMLFSPEVGPRGVFALDARLAAHRDALAIAGDAAVEIAESRLSERDPWQHVAAARVWIEDGRPGPNAVAARLRDATDDALPAWREALRRGGPETSRELAAAGAHRESDRVLALVVDACGWHGAPSPDTPDELAASDAAEVRVALARSLARAPALARSRADGVLRELLRDPDSRVARAALWSVALREPGAAVAYCRRALEEGAAEPFAVQTLGLLGDPADVDRVLPWVAPEATRGAAVRALGNLGSVSSIEFLLHLLESDDEAAAFAAGDAVETMLGVLPEPPRTRRPRARDAGPLPLRASWVREQWRLRSALLDPSRRWHRGRPYPDGGGAAAAEVPMERLWRLAISGLDTAIAGAKREVWDGFFDAAPTYEARPGE